MLFVILAVANCGTLYMSPCGSDRNDGLTQDTPLRSFPEAVGRSSNLRLLLEAGATFTNFPVMTHPVLTEYDSGRNTYALVWDGHALHISTYGGREKATLLSGRYSAEGPQTAIGIVNGGPVTIENINFQRWEIGAIFAYESQNITFRNNRVQYVGTRYFPDETAQMPNGDPVYSVGAIYIKNTYGAEISGNEITDIHNNPDGYWSNSHAIYLTRATDIAIWGNYIARVSGPPLKVRRARTRNVAIYGNQFWYTGPAKQEKAVQKGWLRFSGERGNCPSQILIRDNLFWYPYCWSDCEKKARRGNFRALQVSESRPDECPAQDGVQWENNDIREVFAMDGISVESTPTTSSTSSSSF